MQAVIPIFRLLKEWPFNMKYLFIAGHFVICFLMALWRYDCAIVMALTIELTQIDIAFWRGYLRSRSLWWNIKEFAREYFWGDTILDLAVDATGILAGALL